MGPGKPKLAAAWLHARRYVILLVGLVFGLFFAVYALYGYPWGVAGYAALLGFAAAAVFAVVDFVRYMARAARLAKITGRFPAEGLPPAEDMVDESYHAIIEALEAERARLVEENERNKRDAEQYYTLWAHQIKTPIAAMRLVLQSGAQAPVPRAQVEQELFRIEQYVGMVLQYQRLHSMQSDLVLRSHALQTLVNRAARACAPLFIHKGLALKTGEISQTLVTDEKWFTFVLEQVYTNALKYTDKGQIAVYAQGPATLVVEDTGCGIPPEDLPRVFERGFTGAIGRRERSSTGIGLYLCREILGRLGFGITIESHEGEGTRVLLHLRQQELEME